MSKSAKGRAGAKKPAAKKAKAERGAKKRVARGAAPKKTAAKKRAAKKAAAKKTAAKTAAKKTAAKKTAAKKTAAKKTAARKTARGSQTRAAAGKARGAPPRTAPAKKSAAAKAPAKKGAASAARVAAGEARADESLVERSIALLDEHEERVADAALAVGAHLFESYFAGDEALARSRVPAKALSYDRLVARAEAETSWDAADLRRALVAALVHRSLPPEIAERVPASRLARLDAVDDPAERAALATRIADGELRGRLAEEAIALASRARTGPSRVPGPLRLANALQRLFDRAADFGGLDSAEARGMDELARAELAGRIDDAARKLAAVAAKIRVAV